MLWIGVGLQEARRRGSGFYKWSEEKGACAELLLPLLCRLYHRAGCGSEGGQVGASCVYICIIAFLRCAAIGAFFVAFKEVFYWWSMLLAVL